MEQIQELIAFAEGTAVAYLPGPRDISVLADKFVDDLWRYGPFPVLSGVWLPKRPRFEAFEAPVPPPISTDPILQHWHEGVRQLARRHAKAIFGGTVCLGAGLLLWNHIAQRNRIARQWKNRLNGEKEVIVILGADCPFGSFLLQAFTKQDYILIVSVASSRAVESIERKGRGLIKALVLDPSDPTTLPYFLRSLKSALSLRFPLHAAGDPYSSYSKPTNHLVSVISLLSLVEPPELQPIEQISLSSTYLSYQQSTLLTPLFIIQSLLPLLRISTTSSGKRDQSIVCLVPAAARVGIPLCGCQAMISTSLVAALEILRRELMMTDSGTKVVIVDVGLIIDIDALNPRFGCSQPASETVSRQASSESTLSSVAFMTELRGSRKNRKPSEIRVLEAVIHTVLGKRLESSSQRFWVWLRGDRFSIGAGGTYAVVSRVIPGRILDFLLVLPSRIASLQRAPGDASLEPSHCEPLHTNSGGLVPEKDRESDRESKFDDSWVSIPK